MILKREHYAELSWWRWARLRMILAWSRYTGGFARVLGADGDKAWQTGPLKLRHERSQPRATASIVENEMRLAAAICPTHAIERDVTTGWRLSIPRCISCGLCYPVAPNSLVPSAAHNSSMLPSNQEITDFAKIR